MKINKLLNDKIKDLENYIINPRKGLPESIFLFLTRISPMINVDLLVKNNRGQTLLTWRKKGEKYPAGWHVPGGIIRFKEKASERVKKVAKLELGSEVLFDENPIFIKEIFLNQKNRSHFISLLYLCKLKNKIKINFKNGINNEKMQWFSKCPKNIIKPHVIYKRFINNELLKK